MYKIFNVCLSLTFNSYKQHIINNFEKLLKKKDGLENISIIITLILIKIRMHIRSTRFLDNSAPNVMFSLDGKIQKESVSLLSKNILQC